MTRYVLHTFRPGETIDAVIRLKGRHNLTQDEMAALRNAFNHLNPAEVLKPGMERKIPLCDGAVSQADGVEVDSEGGETD